jgi:hypothetical protein
MKQRKDRRPGTNPPGAAARAGRGPFSGEALETSRQVIRGLLRLCLIILAATLGALFVEALRAIF